VNIGKLAFSGDRHPPLFCSTQKTLVGLVFGYSEVHPPPPWSSNTISGFFPRLECIPPPRLGGLGARPGYPVPPRSGQFDWWCSVLFQTVGACLRGGGPSLRSPFFLHHTYGVFPRGQEIPPVFFFPVPPAFQSRTESSGSPTGVGHHKFRLCHGGDGFCWPRDPPGDPHLYSESNWRSSFGFLALSVPHGGHLFLVFSLYFSPTLVPHWMINFFSLVCHLFPSIKGPSRGVLGNGVFQISVPRVPPPPPEPLV